MVIDQIREATQSSEAGPLIDKLTQDPCLKDQECSKLLLDMRRIFDAASKNPSTVTLNDFQTVVKSNLLLIQEMNYLLEKLPLVHRG